jgi:hypothetical protein
VFILLTRIIFDVFFFVEQLFIKDEQNERRRSTAGRVFSGESPAEAHSEWKGKFSTENVHFVT